MDDFEHRVHVDSGRVRYPGQEAIARLRAEVEALKATLTQQCKGFRADVEKLEAEVEALRADAQAVAALLPGPYYMDPPDGGSVTVIEQLRRMAADAARYRWIKRGASFREERDMGPGGCWSIFVAVPRRPAVNSLDTAIDAAMAQGKV
jgi:multidrug resistance efflux pump